MCGDINYLKPEDGKYSIDSVTRPGDTVVYDNSDKDKIPDDILEFNKIEGKWRKKQAEEARLETEKQEQKDMLAGVGIDINDEKKGAIFKKLLDIIGEVILYGVNDNGLGVENIRKWKLEYANENVPNIIANNITKWFEEDLSEKDKEVIQGVTKALMEGSGSIELTIDDIEKVFDEPVGNVIKKAVRVNKIITLKTLINSTLFLNN